MAPPSQRYRQIGFYLTGGAGLPVKFDLAIRPEDLTVTEPSRLVVQQTLGGAWCDSYDRGLVSIALSGTLGWRGSFLLSGEDAFAQLRQTVLVEWHQRRQDAIDAGTDPSDVTLTFIDTLDDVTYVVAPQQFVLRRSKSSPLLMRYQIRLLAVSDADAPIGLLDEISKALSNPLRWLAGVTGLGGTLSSLGGYLATAQSYLATGKALYGQFTSAVSGYVSTVVGVLDAVQDVASTSRGLFTGADAQLLALASSITRAGANALSAMSPNDDLPDFLILPALRLPAVLRDAECNMANSFSTGQQYTTYEDLMGASTCSSTGGGDPISFYTATQLNPFETIFPELDTHATVTEEATAAMSALGRDPLLLRGQDALIADQLAKITAGVVLK
ncbi:MAG TPA: hypothetical protein VGC15_13075 [Acetobacteraceae bacterium]